MTEPSYWSQIVEHLRPRLNPQTVQTWLRPTYQVEQSNSHLTVSVPTAEFRAFIEDTFHDQIADAIIALRLPFSTIVYSTNDELHPPLPEPAPPAKTLKPVPHSKCPSVPAAAWYVWPRRYREIAGPCSEASDSFHFAGFMVAVGAALGRSIYTVMQRPIYPNLYLSTIGTSGYASKSGAMYLPLRMLREIAPSVTPMYSIDSAEGLIKFMQDKVAADAKRRDSTVLLTLDEMRWLIDKAGMKGLGGAMLALLNKAYDSPDRLETNPKHGAAGIDNPPCLAIYGASTAEDFDRMDAQDMAAGIGRRFIYVPGERKTHPVPDPPPPNAAAWEGLKGELKKTVQFWMERGHTEISVSDEAKKINRDWYLRWFKRPHPDDLISILDSGSRVHLRKVELIFAGLDQSFRIEATHAHAAVAATEFFYDAAQFIFRGYDRSTWAKQEQKLVDLVLAAPKQQLYRRELQRKVKMDGETFLRRLQSVAGREDDPNWDGQLRQIRHGNQVLVVPNRDELEA